METRMKDVKKFSYKIVSPEIKLRNELQNIYQITISHPQILNLTNNKSRAENFVNEFNLREKLKNYALELDFDVEKKLNFSVRVLAFPVQSTQGCLFLVHLATNRKLTTRVLKNTIYDAMFDRKFRLVEGPTSLDLNGDNFEIFLKNTPLEENIDECSFEFFTHLCEKP